MKVPSVGRSGSEDRGKVSERERLPLHPAATPSSSSSAVDFHSSRPEEREENLSIHFLSEAPERIAQRKLFVSERHLYFEKRPLISANQTPGLQVTVETASLVRHVRNVLMVNTSSRRGQRSDYSQRRVWFVLLLWWQRATANQLPESCCWSPGAPGGLEKGSSSSRRTIYKFRRFKKAWKIFQGFLKIL